MSYIGTQPTPQSLQSRQQFTGDGSTTTFTTIGGVELYEDVFLNGVRLSRVDNEYSFDGTTLTITPAPANGDTVSIILRNDHSELIALPITDSQGNNVLSESGSVVTLSADEANVGSNALVVDSSGKVGIGTSSPSQSLTIYNAFDNQIKLQNGANANQSYEFGRNGSNGLLTFYGNQSGFTGYVFDGADGERMRIDSSGNLLVGYASSNGSYKLQVNSQIYATSSTIATSDFNYKENITPLDGALSLVSQLNPVQFDWKEHSIHEFDRNQPTIGFIAQEVQQVLSNQPYLNSIVKSNECVLEPEETDEEGNVIKEAVIEEFLGIAEGNMIALLTKAIQEQQVIIESQQSQIDALTARIEALETV